MTNFTNSTITLQLRLTYISTLELIIHGTFCHTAKTEHLVLPLGESWMLGTYLGLPFPTTTSYIYYREKDKFEDTKGVRGHQKPYIIYRRTNNTSLVHL